jgi:GNAT superfamily N-acetyltransferase
MIIRKINENDAENFLKFLYQLDMETKNMMYEPDERKTSVGEMKARLNSIRNTNSLILIAEDNRLIVGFLSAERGFANRIKHSAYIVVGVLQNYRKKGIGQVLFEGMERWARKNALIRLELTVILHNEAAVHLYKKMGFKVEGIKEKSLNIDGIFVDEYYMSKIL